MSNSILPHLLSDSPPPLVADDEEFDDEFGDFKGSEELSFDNDNPSTPSSLKNPNEYFPDRYTDFNSCHVEESYQIFETPEDKSTTNIKSAIPSSDYFTLWEHIENNIQEIIDSGEDAKETIANLKKGEDVNNISTYQSNENLQNSEHHDERTYVENKSSKEEVTDNLFTSEYNAFETENFNDLNMQINAGHEIESQNDEEKCKSNSGTTENILEPVLDTIDNEQCVDFNIEESISQNINIEDFHLSGSVEENSVYADNGSISLQKVDNDEARSISPSDTKKSNKLEDVLAPQNSLESDEIAENQESEDDFGEFADFTSSNNPIPETKPSSIDTDNEDDFYEFGSYQISCTANNTINSSNSGDSTQDPVESRQNVNTKEIDEFENFNDFASYSGHAQESYDSESHILDGVLKICKTPEEALKETHDVLEKIFASSECTTPEYSNCEYIMNNSVFENLKDITETNALTYQWCKSVAQKNILRTLNIDIRNILYGPAWNSGMPIFAPNLCSKPLEPTRSELPIPISPQKIIESQETTMPTMPQFDWSGSGLPDLQDSSVNVNVNEFQRNPREPDGEFEVIQQIYIDPVAIPPKFNNFEEDLSQSRQLEAISTMEDCQEFADDFSEFTSYQESIEKETKWKNMLPLRESHISSNAQQDNLETDKISIYFQELTMGKSEPVVCDQLKTNPKISSNDGLKLFENKEFLTDSLSELNEFEKIEPKLKELTSQYDSLKNDVSYLETGCDMSVYNFSPMEIEEKTKENVIPDQKSVTHQEDDFTDFQSSLPCQSRPPTQAALLEPLKPAVLQPESIIDKHVKIEWPEPGLDEQEINRIVNGVLRKNSTNENVTEKTKNVATTETNPNKPIKKDDHDEWSDFISVKEPLKSRTSTPDLPLSVFNLGNIQPKIASAPFIAPNGVIHSPSRTPNIGFPVANRNLLNGTQQHTHQQPFITSQAFNALYSNTKNNTLPTSRSRKTADIKQSVNPFSSEKNMIANCSEQNLGPFTQSGRNYKMQRGSSSTYSNTEDDDWGDFVSAPNTISHSNSSANFFQTQSYSKTNLGFSSKAAMTQKFSIIPKNTVVNQEKTNFPVISTMPDLDFVSPKSKSTIK